jgi:hypothetical protein
MHSAALQPALIKSRPAWSPSMLLLAAVAAAAVALPLSSMWQQQSSLLPRKQASRLPTLAATQVLAKLCGALSDPISLHTLQSCCTLKQVLTLQSAVSSCPRDVL